MDIVSKLCITALYVISKSCFTNIFIFDTISFTDIYFISYTVCISDPEFRARKTAYARQLDISFETHMAGREEQLNKFFVDYTRYLHFNDHWMVMQFGRGDNPDPFPVVQMACVPQHHILKDEDADLEGTCDVYDMKALPSNIDYEQQGYLLKTAFLHFLRPLPKWVQEVHKGYFDDSPVDAQKLETRDKAAKPENIVKELEKKASSHQSVHAPEYILYTAAQFGAILKAHVTEAFGDLTLPEGTFYWDNYRLYLAIFRKWLTKGFTPVSTASVVQQVEVIDGRTDKPVLNRPEDESFFEATDGDASKADEGKCLVFNSHS